MAFEKYDINWTKLGSWLTPKWIKKPVFNIVLKSCFQPIVLIYNAFIRYRSAKLYEIKMNYQVCYLEAFLNDRFDFTQRRIYIDDAQIQEAVYLYQEEELKPLYVYQDSEDQPVYIYTEGESTGDLLNDFIVYIPAEIVYQEPEVRAMIGSKLSGKRYKIQTF